MSRRHTTAGLEGPARYSAPHRPQRKDMKEETHTQEQPEEKKKARCLP